MKQLIFNVDFSQHKKIYSPSFPSGHAVEVYVLGMSFSRLFPKCKWEIFSACIAAIMIAWSPMDLEVDYPSDIFGSLLISFPVAVFL